MKISVCIATYNGEEYIIEQLNSILPQLKEKDEIVISDDYSSDKTVMLIESLNDSRIKIFYNVKKKGYTGNFENALNNSSGDVIFISDQDDIWLPNKTQECLSQLKNFDFVVSDGRVVNSSLSVIYNSFFAISKPYSSLMGNIFKFSYLGCCMSFRKELLIKALPFPENHLLCTHDNWLFLVAASFYKVKIISEPLILYRRHNSNTSGGRLDKIKKNSILKMIKYRLYLVFNLVIRINSSVKTPNSSMQQ